MEVVGLVRAQKIILSLIVLCLFSGGAWTATSIVQPIHGGTGQGVYTAGDTLSATSSIVLGKVAIGTNTTVAVADSAVSGKVKWAIPTGAGGRAIFGDGIDGVLALDGTNTFSGLYSKSGNTYTQLRDVVGTTITVSPTVTVKTNNYRTFANITVVVNGTLCNSGLNGGIVNPQAVPTPGVYNSGGIGGVGGGPICTVGNAGNPAPDVCYSVGGAGGSGSCGPCGGGAGGAANQIVARAGGFVSARTLWLAFAYVADPSPVRITGGSGGGGSGGPCCSGPACSGSGGNGGGIIAIVAPSVTGTGTIRAKGGNGAAHLDLSGGGAGGGALMFLTNQAVCTHLTLQVCGGTPAPGTCGAGAGTAGNIFKVLNQ